MVHLRPQIVAADSRRLGGKLASPLKRGWCRAAVVALAVGLACCAVASPATGRRDERPGLAPPLQRSIVVELNAVRREHGLPPLRVAAGLAAAARQHSFEMAKIGYFGHGAAGGESFARRIARFYPMGKRRRWSAGETLYWSSGEPEAHAAVEAWLRSREHRVILLSRAWREFGIGAVFVSAAPGIYGGADVTIVTADFGARS
jgi:uncharacterized protein YkwD